MRVLCVAEKPSISKSISQILSGGQFTTNATKSPYIKNYEFAYPQTNSFYVVTCVSGHLTGSDFTERHRKWNSCDAFELFDAPIETKVATDKKAIEENLLTQARRADMLMIWTDCDREGEHIGMEITRVCRRARRDITVKRARFSAIIAQQIHRAAQHPVELDRAQCDAVEARITLDLIVGAAFTRMQTMVLQGRFAQIANSQSIISYGPCQFPTLGFIVQKWSLVKSFVSEPFWYIYLSLIRPEGGAETTFNWRRGHLFDEHMAIALYDFVLSNPLAHVTKVTKKGTKKWKPLPLTTVELQKAGSRLLRLAPKKVLDVAEKLYQQGFLSYPRTETDQFDPQFDFQSLIQKQTVDPLWGEFATSLTQDGFSAPRKGKNNDKAHPPIHPTAHAGILVGDEKKVYEFITRRFLACCSKDAEGWQTSVDIECGGEEFSASGLRVLERNYLLVYPYDKWSDHQLPDFQEGEEFQPSVCELREGKTSKPNFLTEADLVTLMDKNGIGTDATIAQHIQTIIDRDYVIEQMEGNVKYLLPSKLGVGLIEGYNKIGLNQSLGKPQLRREVCEGTKTKADMLEEAITQYKEMFIISRREFEKVISSVRRYLDGDGRENTAEGGGRGGGGGGGGGSNGGGGVGGSSMGRRGGGRAPRGRGATPQGGCGRVGDNPAVEIPDSGDDLDPLPAPRSSKGRQTGQLITKPSSRQAKSSTLNTRRPPKPPAGRLPSSNNLNPTPLTVTGMQQVTHSPSGTNSTMRCDCGVPAVQRTHTSESVSKGKKYWTCGREGTCAFYQRDASANNEVQIIPSKRSHSTQRQDTRSETGPICKCNKPTRQLTVNADIPTKGKLFWRCANSKGEGDCGFFEWDGQPEGTTARAPAPGVTSQVSGECFKCNQPGHWASNCPSDGGSSKRQRSFGASTTAASSKVTCFKCQEEGHFSNACPNGEVKRPGSGRGGGGSTSDACYKCGQTGHWSSACTGEGASRSTPTSRGSEKRGRGRGSTRAKRGRGTKKRSAYGAPD